MVTDKKLQMNLRNLIFRSECQLSRKGRVYFALLLLKHTIDKPEAKSQSKAQSPKKPQKGKEEFGLWASH